MAKPRDGGIGGQATGQRTASKSRKIGKCRSKASAAPTRLRPPERGATVRMYRHGHGDCFLLAFRGEDGQPVYVLIDGGYKPGSNGDTFGLADFPTVVEDIAAATGKRLDLVIVTHEHQD